MPRGLALHRERERRIGACVANRVLREVACEHAEHPWSDGELDACIAFEAELDSCAAGTFFELVEGLLEHRTNRRRAERHDARAGFELAEEENLVDQLGDLLNLARGLLDELDHVLA